MQQSNSVTQRKSLEFLEDYQLWQKSGEYSRRYVVSIATKMHIGVCNAERIITTRPYLRNITRSLMIIKLFLSHFEKKNKNKRHNHIHPNLYKANQSIAFFIGVIE